MRRWLAITSKIGCAVDCKYCPQKTLVEAYSKRSNIFEMSLEMFKDYIDKVPKTITLRISGFCENFLNKSCIDMIDYAFNSGFNRLCLYTTLEGATLDTVKKLGQYHFSEMGFYLADGNNNSKITVDDEYYKKIEFIMTHWPTAWYMYHSSRAEPEIAKMLSKYNIKYSAMGIGDDKCGLVRDGKKTAYKKGRLQCVCRGCPQMRTTNCLLPNGDVILCMQDYTLDFTLGNLNSQKYEDIISVNNPVYKEILRKMNSEDDDILCRRCCHSVQMAQDNG